MKSFLFIVLTLYFASSFHALNVVSRNLFTLMFLFVVGLTGRTILIRLRPNGRDSCERIIDALLNQFVKRKSLTKTFVRLMMWNLTIDFLLIVTGFLTLGIFPLVWTPLILVINGPEPSSYKKYEYLWFESAALILSASLGSWGGLKINQFFGDALNITLTLSGLIILIRITASFLETLELRDYR
ncbi:hypothetical protein CW702_02540 [Candidatus Bathyarchaeota archaeon]|nr:MAG: hypothetical protein CW702_02540 [Candidatus Bathyarchaeota archaeon]